MKRDTINILWIEDNPRMATPSTINIEGEEFEIPDIVIDGETEKNFTLKILQHPEEIREYLMMCNKVIANYGHTKLGLHPEIIPDIVVAANIGALP